MTKKYMTFSVNGVIILNIPEFLGSGKVDVYLIGKPI